MQVNLDNSRAMSALTFLLFKLNTLQKKTRQSFSQSKSWCNDSGVLSSHHGYYTTIMTLEVVSSQPSITWYKSTKQKIGILKVYES